MVANAIVKNLHQKIFDEVITHADIPTEFGNRENLTKASEELQRTLNDRSTRVRILEEGGNFYCLYKIIFILNLILYIIDCILEKSRTIDLYTTFQTLYIQTCK